jgi:hypothetical protein
MAALSSSTEPDRPGRSPRQTRSTASGLSRDPSLSEPLLFDGGDAPDTSCRFSTSPVGVADPKPTGLVTSGDVEKELLVRIFAAGLFGGNPVPNIFGSMERLASSPQRGGVEGDRAGDAYAGAATGSVR